MIPTGATLRSEDGLRRGGALFLLLAAWGLLFGPSLVTGHLLAYRDAAHYYYPLFAHIRALRATQWFPLWTPLEDLGRPLAGDPTSGVFYPLSLLLALPLSFTRLFATYVALHGLLAAWTMYSTRRSSGSGRGAATCAAIAYSSGGYLVSQHANVVYLVGAAWLPLAMHHGWRAIESARWRDLVIGAAAMAMMVLGGDPQTACHAGIVLGLFIVLRPPSSVLPRPSSRAIARPVARWILILALAAGLASPQIWLGMNWSRSSTLAWGESPRTLWESVAWRIVSRRIASQRIASRDAERSSMPGEVRPSLAPSVAPSLAPVVGPSVAPSVAPSLAPLVGPSVADRPRSEPTRSDPIAYRFAYPPWRLAELIWPNISGRSYPEYRRWTKAALGEERVWFPSTYIGLLPLLAALHGIRGWRHDQSRRLLVGCAALSVLAAAGDLGVGHAINRVLGTSYSSEVGGVYWFLSQLIPGYAMFRYPAKWIVFLSWALAGLASIGWDDCVSSARDSRSMRMNFRWLGIGIALASLVGIAIGLSRGWWLTLDSRLAPDATFGPFRGGGAWWDVIGSLTQHLVVATCLGLLFIVRTRWSVFGRSSICLLLLAIADLTWAHAWQLRTVNERLLAEPSAASAAIGRDLAARADVIPDNRILVYRGIQRPWRPASWSRESSTQRLAELIAWDRATLHPKYHLIAGPPNLALLESSGPAIDGALASYLRVASRIQSEPSGRPPNECLAALGVQYLLLPDDAGTVVGAERVPLPRGVANLALWRIPQCASRVTIVHARDVIRSIPAGPSQWLDDQTMHYLFSEGRLRNLAEWALIEANGPVPPVERPPDDGLESCTWTSAPDGRSAVNVELASAGLLIVRELYDPAWRAWVSTDGGSARRVPVLRADRIFRGVHLPAGRHRVEFTYEPPYLQGVFVFCTLAWAAVLVIGVVGLRRQFGSRG